MTVDDPRPVESLRNRRQRLRTRQRAEYIAEVEAEWRRRNGRPMSAAELERVLRTYPGDA